MFIFKLMWWLFKAVFFFYFCVIWNYESPGYLAFIGTVFAVFYLLTSFPIPFSKEKTIHNSEPGAEEDQPGKNTTLININIIIPDNIHSDQKKL